MRLVKGDEAIHLRLAEWKVVLLNKPNEVIPMADAIKEVEVAMSRVALLHLAYARTLVEEYGEEQGREVTIKAIMEYGKLIADWIKRGHADLPKFGVVGKFWRDDQNRFVARDCVLTRVFKEFDALEEGCLYCYVDAAKSMATDPTEKLIHSTCEACGDEYCTFEKKPTTAEEQKAFKSRDKQWRYVDPRLVNEK